MALTKVTGGILSQPIDLGITTATTGFFSGIVTAQSVRVLGDLTVDGSTTTLDTVVTEVDRLEIGANNTTVGVAITQSGTGNALTIDDGNTRVFTVKDGGSVRIGDNASYTPATGAEDLVVGALTGNNNGITIITGSGNQTGSLSFADSASGNPGALFYRHTDNTMLFRVAGGTRMSIKGASGGKVGIGTTNPSQSLHIYNSSPIIQFTDPDSGLGSRINADSGNLYLDTHNENRDIVFRGGNSSANEVARITGDGKVGIGTDNPATKLHIFDSSADPYLKIGGSGRDCGIQLDAATNFTAFRTDAANRLFVNAGGDSIRFSIGGTGSEKLRINSSGNVGINSTVPATKLDIRLGAAWIYPDEDGTEAVALKLGKLKDYNSPLNEILVADNDNSSTPTYQVTNKINRYIAKWHFDRVTSPGATRLNAFQLRSYNSGTTLGNSFIIRDRQNTIDSVKLWSEGHSFIGVGTAGATINLGIGTDNPQAKLDVTAGPVNNAAFFKTISDKSLIEFENSAGSTYNTRIGSMTLGVGNVGLMFETGTSSDRLQAMVIDRYGNVGIGTNNAGTTLDVHGFLQVKDSTGKLSMQMDGANGQFKVFQSPAGWNNLDFNPNPILAWDFKSGPGDLMYMASGGNTATATQMALVISDSHGFKVGRSGYDGTDFDVSPTAEYFRIATGGNVGIGTNAPTQKLEVKYGEAWIDNNSGDSIARSNGFTVSHAPNANFTVGSDPNDARRTATFAVKGASRASVVALRNIDDDSAFWDFIADGNTNKFYIQRGGSGGAALGPAVSIDTSLNVGIGTASPGDARLRVVHDGLNKVLQQWGGAQGSAAGQRFMELYSPATDNANDYFRFQTGNAFKFRIDTLDALAMNSSANIGIGTDNPAAHLEVSAYQNVEVLRLRDRHFNKYLTIRGGGSPNRMVIDSYEGGGGGAAIDLASNGDTKVRFTSDGKVGIGTSVPDHNLHVYQEAGDAVITIESTGNGNHSALEFMRTTSGGDSKGAGSIYVTGDTSESAAKMQFGVAHNIGHGVFSKMTIDGQNGHVGIGTEFPVKALHVQHSDCRIRLTEVGEATDVELQNNSGHGVLTTNGASQLRLQTNNEARLVITATGHIVTQDLGLTGTSFNNDTSNAKVFEVTGDGTVGEYGVINISGNSNSNSGVIGRIYFTNRENSNSSSVTSANSKALAYIDTYATSTDSNAGDDCGGILRFSTKRDGAGSLERIRITNDGRIGINDNSPNGYEVDLQNRSDSTGNDTQVRIYNTQTGSTNDTVIRNQIAGTTANNYIYFGDGDDTNAGQIRYNHSNNFMSFNVNATEQLRIISTGNVGIGTITPNSLLHLHKSSTSGFDGLRLTNSTTGVSETSGFSIELEDTEGARIWHYGNENISFGVDNELHGTLRSDGRWCLGPNQTSGSKELNVFAATGPSAEFHSNSDAGISIKDNSDSSAVEITNNNGQLTIDLDHSGQVTTEAFIIEKNGGSGGTAELFRITSDGKVGINSTSPQKQLDIVGDDGLMIRTSSNGGASGSGGAVIKMTDQTPSDDQAGFIKYRHVDSQSPGDNYGSAFFVTSETSTNAFVIGDFEHDNPAFNNDLLVKRNVGIGTEKLARGPLHIHQRSSDDVQIHMSNTETGSTSSGRGFTIFGGAGTSGRDMGFVNRETTGAIEFYTNIGGTLAQRGAWHTGPDITTFAINTASNGNHSCFLVSNHDTTNYNGVANRTEYPMLSDVHFTGTDNPTANRTHAAWRNDVENSITTGSNSSGSRIQVYGIHSTLNSTKYAYILYGAYLFCNSTADNAVTTQTLMGAYGYAQGYINASSSAQGANIYGGHFIGYRGGETTGGHCYGMMGRAQQTTNGVGTKTGDMTGVLGEVEIDEGQITNGYSFRAIVDMDNNTGDGVSFASTMTTGYLYHGTYNISSGTTVTNKRGIWLLGSTDNYIAGDLEISGEITKGSGTFRIPHPLVGLSTTKDLVHSFIEGPQMDLIYRGKTTLVGGISTVNLDTKSGMTEGTFVELNRDIQCFTTNETGWTNVKGSVTGNQLTIIAQENTCTDTISWMVIGERQDDVIKAAAMTDADGNLIVEPDKKPSKDPVKYECEDNIYNADPNYNPKDD